MTGPPGSGKTAILERIRAQIRCVEEPAREVLAAERAHGGEGTWDRNRARFIELLLQRSIEKYEHGRRLNETVLFDRGVPDCIVYAIRAGTDSATSREAAEAFRYERRAFYLEPWSDIYRTDEERIMSFEDTVSFDRSLRDVYRELGYTLTRVPRGSVDERAQFILARIAGSEDASAIS